MPFRPVEKPKKADYVVESLVSLLTSGELKHGDRLPPENELAEKFQVSRITIREAIKELSLMGAVVVRQGGGTFISNCSPEHYMKKVFPIMVFSRQSGEDLYDARRYTEMGTAHFAALNHTPEQLAQLRAILDRQWKLLKEDKLHGTYPHSDGEFHACIARMSGNPYMQATYTTLSDLLVACINKAQTLIKAREAAYTEHEEVFRAIEARSVARAEKAMARHLANAKEFFLEAEAEGDDGAEKESDGGMTAPSL